MRLLLALCILLVVYLSLYPFDFIGVPGPRLTFSFPATGGEWVDVIDNLMFYMPLGFLGMAVWRGRMSIGFTVVCVFAVLLSLSMELAQVYLPTRDSSLRDTACNAVGTLLGCLAYQRVRASRVRIPVPRLAPSGGLLIACWLVWQLFPLIPVFRRTKLAETFAQLFSMQFHGGEFVDILLAAILLYAFLARPEKRPGGETACLVSAILFLVLLMQSLVMGLTYSNLRVIAAFTGLVAACCFWRPGLRTSWIVLASVVLVWTVVREIAAPMRFTWVPFDIEGVSPELASDIRGVAGRAFFFCATLLALVRAGAPSRALEVKP